MMKIFVDCSTAGSGNDLLGLSIKTVVPLFTNVVIADNKEEAQLIIVDSKRKIGGEIESEKNYAIINVSKDEDYSDLPVNVRVIHINRAIFELCDYMSKIKEKNEQNQLSASKTLPANAAVNGPKVLVIDDNSKHRIAAQEQLAAEYSLTLAASYDLALDLLKKIKFDAVLTDLYLPMSPKTLSEEAFKLGQLVPYGLLIALEALRRNVKFIAVVTDINHHQDAISAAFDNFNELISLADSKIMLINAPLINGAKNWREVLEKFKI